MLDAQVTHSTGEPGIVTGILKNSKKSRNCQGIFTLVREFSFYREKSKLKEPMKRDEHRSPFVNASSGSRDISF